MLLAIIPLLGVPSQPFPAQPFPDSAEYADSAFQIANGNGFRTIVDERAPVDRQPVQKVLVPSRYPPGFSLVLAPFVRYGDNSIDDTLSGARAIAVLLVISLFAAAWGLGGALAAGIAALLAALAPFVRNSATIVMSDALAALLALLILLALSIAWSTRTRVRLQSACLLAAGVLAGYSVLNRLSAVTVFASLLVTNRDRRSSRLIVLGAAPFLIFLGTYQWTEFGNPLKTGYDYYFPGFREFSLGASVTHNPHSDGKYIHNDRLDGALMEWTCPCGAGGPMGTASNAVFYPAVLLGIYWIYMPPLFSLFGILELYRRRRSKPAKFAVAAIISNLVMFVFYYYQGARLLAPASMLLTTYAAVGASGRIERIVGHLGAMRTRRQRTSYSSATSA